MRAENKHMLPAVLLLFIAVAGSGCGLSLKPEIRTENASEKEITGTYSLILYGGGYLTDLETVAILSKDDATYEIEPYAPNFDYRIIKHLPAKEALARAYSFLSRHPDFSGIQFSRIVDSNGAVIGYELQRIYTIMTFGSSSILDIFYWRKGDRVFVDIRLDPSVEREFMESKGLPGF